MGFGVKADSALLPKVLERGDKTGIALTGIFRHPLLKGYSGYDGGKTLASLTSFLALCLDANKDTELVSFRDGPLQVRSDPREGVVGRLRGAAFVILRLGDIPPVVCADYVGRLRRKPDLPPRSPESRMRTNVRREENLHYQSESCCF